MTSSEIYQAQAVLQEKQEWAKWQKEIPFISWPEGWQVKSIPPFHGAVLRYLVRTPDMKEGEWVSIYLDCYEALGYFDGPYWEVYPFDDDTYRCGINEVDKLLRAVTTSISQIQGPSHKEKALTGLRHAEEKSGDNEAMHSDADKVILQYLYDIGETEVADMYSKLMEGFWYA